MRVALLYDLYIPRADSAGFRQACLPLNSELTLPVARIFLTINGKTRIAIVHHTEYWLENDVLFYVVQPDFDSRIFNKHIKASEDWLKLKAVDKWIKGT